MITLYKANYTTKVYYFRGLEADEKPSKWQGCNVGPNSIYLALDATPTPKAYCYNGSEWSQVALSTDILNKYYTAQQVDELIAIAQLEGAGVDTTNFVMQSELEPVVAEQHAYTDAVETAHDEFEKSLKKDYEDVEYDTVAERLKEDMGALYNRMNEADLVPYESASGHINAQNTYKGITRDSVIKGKTWQNLCGRVEGDITMEGEMKTILYTLPFELKDNQWYTFITIIKTNTLNDSSKLRVGRPETYGAGLTLPSAFTTGLYVGRLLTNKSKATAWGNPQCNFFTMSGAVGSITFTKPVILEGDYTNVPISELPMSVNGIESVKSPITVKSINKNLFNPNNVIKGVELNADTGGTEPNADWFVTEYIKVKPSTSYYLTKGGDSGYSNSCYDINKNYLGRFEQLNGLLNLPAGVEYLRFNSTLSLLDSEIQFEEGTTATSYEPYKEHSVTYELDEPLRSHTTNKNICDYIRNEYVIRSIVKMHILPSYDWRHESTTSEYIEYAAYVPGEPFDISSYTNKVNQTSSSRIVRVNNFVYIRTLLSTGLDTISKFIAWIGTDTYVYYRTSAPIITPIDTQELVTYDGTTNIVVETENIKPVISTSIPSNVPAVLATAMAENKALRAQLAATNTSVEEVQNGSTVNEENVEMLTECVIEMADILYS